MDAFETAQDLPRQSASLNFLLRLKHFSAKLGPIKTLGSNRLGTKLDLDGSGRQPTNPGGSGGREHHKESNPTF